jgi:hypothetical protein
LGPTTATDAEEDDGAEALAAAAPPAGPADVDGFLAVACAIQYYKFQHKKYIWLALVENFRNKQ